MNSFKEILIQQTTKTKTSSGSFSITEISKEIKMSQAKVFEIQDCYLTLEFPYQSMRHKFVEVLKAKGYMYSLDGDHYLIMYI